MLDLEQRGSQNSSKVIKDSFQFAGTGKTMAPNIYEKCAWECINLSLKISEQEAKCIKACYSKEYREIGFGDAKLYL